MSKEAEILFPKGQELTIDGKEITVSRMKLHQIIKATGLLSGVFDIVFQLFNDDEINPKAIFDLFVSDGDNMLEFVSIAVGKDRKWTDNLEMDEAILVLIAILEVNMDFFVSTVMPMINSRTESLQLFKSKT